MFFAQKIAVIVPAYNEELLIQKTIQGIPSWVDRIFVIDDASSDQTAKKVSLLSRNGLKLIQHKKNEGVGKALVTGYRAALSEGIDCMVVMAGDAQMDPNDLSSLLQPVINQKADYVKGNRLAHPGVWKIMPLWRLLGTTFLSWITRVLSGYWHLCDSQCGYTAITYQTLQTLDLDRLYPRYGYPNDLLIQLGAKNARLVEVPVRPIYGEEMSGIHPIKIIPRLVFVLFRAFCLRIWRKFEEKSL